jgi:hypothetical protein
MPDLSRGERWHSIVHKGRVLALNKSIVNFIFMICINLPPFPTLQISWYILLVDPLFHTAVTSFVVSVGVWIFSVMTQYHKCPHKSNGICLSRLILKHEQELRDPKDSAKLI